MDVDLAVPEIAQSPDLAHEPLKLMIRFEDFEGREIAGRPVRGPWRG